jgi:hypothetical protein
VYLSASVVPLPMSVTIILHCSSLNFVPYVRRGVISPRRFSRMGENRTTNRLLVRNPEGKRPLRKPRRRRVDNINMGLEGMGWGCVDYIGLARNRDR